MNIIPILQKLYPENSIGPGIGAYQGQCAVFAQALFVLPKVGDSYSQKKQAVKDYGIIYDSSVQLQVGDACITSEGTFLGLGNGHVTVIANFVNGQPIAAESNFKNDRRVHYGRVIPTSKIYGIIRGDLRFKLNITYPITLNISLIINMPAWASLNKHIDNAKNWFYTASGGKLALNIIPVYSNIPPTWDIEANPVSHIKESWFNEFILPLRFPGSHIVIFDTDRKDFPDSVYGDPTSFELGFSYKYNTNFPLKIMTLCYENDDYPPYYQTLGGYAKYICHELNHLLYGVCANQNVVPGGDYTHNHFLGENNYPVKPEDCFKDFNFDRLAMKL